MQVPKVRNLVVQTENGVQDATKPFQPFGSRPKTWSQPLYVGSQEALFQKPPFGNSRIDTLNLGGSYQKVGTLLSIYTWLLFRGGICR